MRAVLPITRLPFDPLSLGGVAEWSIAAALKAADRVSRSGGSNPSPSALTIQHLLLVGLLLLGGGAVTLLLHAAAAPEALLELLYDSLLSGLDVPEDPSQTARDIVGYVSLIGGIAELTAGLAILAFAALKHREG